LIHLPKIVVIVGPTASGKSSLGIKLARNFNGEIISADSRQVYRGMDIGTGKVTKREQKIIRHHLIDIISPKNIFTADDFKKLGQKTIDNIFAQGKTPIIVGGAGFYIDVLLGRMGVAEVPPNFKLRTNLDKLTVEKLFKKFQSLDPERAKTIDHHNKRRLIRTLEIIRSLGKVPTSKSHKSLCKIIWLGLRPRNLESRIKLRLKKRLELGMVGEVKKLLKTGVSHKRLRDLGLEYRWISKYLKSEVTKKEMEKNLYHDIVRYSKRQMTWFKRNKEIRWVKGQKEATNLVRNFLF